MLTTYALRLFGLDADPRRDELETAIREELEQDGLHFAVEVAVLGPDDPPGAGAPSVGVYLGSEQAAAAEDLSSRVEAALESGLAVVPVVDDLTRFSELVPAVLGPINGIEWSGGGASVRAARTLLEELGVQEQSRRVFISHKREDGLGAAEQLHDRLSHHRFLPFIDRFTIPYGRRVQDTIADALEDYAFLLLLETPKAHESKWVFDEVDYGLSHTMGMLILRWPGDPKPVPGSRGLARVEFEDDDMTLDDHGYQVFTVDALDRIVAEVEAAHARGLVRRRKILVSNIEDAAVGGGCRSCVPLPGWRLRVENDDGITIVGTATRLPTGEDLHALDDARTSDTAGASAVLVHSARVLRPERRRHLEWVAGDRDLVLTPENAVGGYWTFP